MVFDWSNDKTCPTKTQVSARGGSILIWVDGAPCPAIALATADAPSAPGCGAIGDVANALEELAAGTLA